MVSESVLLYNTGSCRFSCDVKLFLPEKSASDFQRPLSTTYTIHLLPIYHVGCPLHRGQLTGKLGKMRRSVLQKRASSKEALVDGLAPMVVRDGLTNLTCDCPRTFKRSVSRKGRRAAEGAVTTQPWEHSLLTIVSGIDSCCAM